MRYQHDPDNGQNFYHEDIVRPWNPKVRPRLCAAGKPPSKHSVLSQANGQPPTQKSHDRSYEELRG